LPVITKTDHCNITCTTGNLQMLLQKLKTGNAVGLQSDTLLEEKGIAT
jgi:hypothetical protein